jgi:peptide/nickel transport system substrate-binding protein
MARIQRRNFLKLAATTAAASFAIACGAAPAAPTAQPAAKTADAPKPAEPAKAAEPAKPAAAAPPAATAAPVTVQQTAATPVTAAAATAGKYKEAPQLAQLVKDGKLPAVDQRLPATPRVIKPLEEPGQYGGVWHRALRGLADRVGPTKLLEERAIEWDAPDVNTIRLVANFYEKWEQNADASEFTFHMRKGVKWSDGTEVTTEDTKFYWEIQFDKELTANPNNGVRLRVGNDWKNAELTVVDKYTFKVKFAGPKPLLPMELAKNGYGIGGVSQMPAYVAPAHYLKKFMPKYGDKAALDKLAADKKLANWAELWGKAGNHEGPIGFWFLNPELPVLSPWKVDKPIPADPVTMVRNPYYWQVDDQGNQLPYIDTIEHANFENNEVLKLWVASGKIDMQGRHMDVGAYTFYKENEAKGGYRTMNWRAASTDAYYPNINTPDKELAKLFETPDFREALNLAVNRKEINDVIWNGIGKARQYSPVAGSPEYDEAMEQKWVQYDVKRANELLDKMGLTKGGDGIRKRPDGKPLELTIEHSSVQGSASNDQHELVKKYWTAIGIRTSAKGVDRSLYEEHVHQGEVEVGFWSWDRASVNKADPGRWLGTIDDGPWAPNYGHWYVQNAYKKEEPPQGHMIRKIWDLWEKTQGEPDEAKRNALFQEIIKIHAQAPVAVGVNGEKVVPFIVKNNFRNFKAGYINDDTLRDEGLINPQQFFIKP